MRELFAAAAVVAVLVGAAFLLPVSYNGPVPIVAQRTAGTSAPENNLSRTAYGKKPGLRAGIRCPLARLSPALRQAAASRPQTTAQAVPAAAAAGQPPGNPQAGRQVYRKCQACHSLEPGKNSLGPSLAGIVGKKAASDPTYNYSPALRSANVTWDLKTLDAYLIDPQKVVPGNKMPFPGLKTENERQDILAYLSGGAPPAAASAPRQAQQQAQTAATSQQQAAPPPAAPPAYVPEARYTLRSGIAEGRMVYLGVGGTIDGQINPVLSAVEGQMVQIILLNGEGAEHDIVFPDQDARSQKITGRGGEHKHGVPCRPQRRLHLLLRRAGSPACRNGRKIYRQSGASCTNACRGQHFADRKLISRRRSVTDLPRL